MTETIILSIAAFAGTNIDDMFIDMILFSEAETSAERRGILFGKYLGMGVLVALSVLGSWGVRLIPVRLLSGLGIVPIFLGIKELIENIRINENEYITVNKQKNFRPVLHTVMITIANGADNIGVYVPLFAGFLIWQIGMTIGVFAVLTAVWCFLGQKLADLPILRKFLEKYRSAVVPVVYILLGVYLLKKM